MHANKPFYELHTFQPNVSGLSQRVAGCSLFWCPLWPLQCNQSDSAAGSRKDIREPQLCSAKEIVSTLPSLKGLGILLLQSAHANISPRLSAASLSFSLLRERYYFPSSSLIFPKAAVQNLPLFLCHLFYLPFLFPNPTSLLLKLLSKGLPCDSCVLELSG